MKKNSKILILTGIFPPDIGGPVAQIVPLADELVKRGYNVGILTYGRKNGINYNFSVRKISGPFRKIKYLLNGLAWSLKFDVVYSWDLYSAGLTSLVIKKLLGKKVINRFAGDSAWEKSASDGLIGNDDVLVFQEKKYSDKIEHWKKARRKILVSSDRVIVVSNFLKKVAMKIGVPKEKIEVINNSVDIVGASPYIRSALPKEIILLTAARLVKWKGVDMLIEIMPDLAKIRGKIKLIVAGDGPEMNQLKILRKKLKLENIVIFKGKISRSELAICMRTADLFLLNTNYEGMSHTILEAMKAGIPVITTNAGGNPEIIIDKKTGLLLNYGDKEQWIWAINTLLDNPNLARKLAEQAKNSLGKFNWENLIEKTIKVFREL